MVSFETVTTPPAPDESLHTLALACIPRLGPTRVRKLLERHPVASEALAQVAGGDREAQGALERARSVRDRCVARGVTLVTCTESHYPEGLRTLEDPPVALFTLGALACAVPPAVALVGSRHPTSYGRHVARDFARGLAARGICVVSGLAAGIDAEAHAGALDAGGPTVAVQGTGVDVPYPRANTRLHAEIARRGLVISELPPGRAAHPGAFPRRNRLIAALADVIVVVEAGATSGALITAQLGRDLGRFVAAVPGPIGVDSSRGANTLLRDGAHTIASFDDVLALLALTRRGREAMRGGAVAERGGRNDIASAPAIGRRAADATEGRVLALLAHGPRFPDELLQAGALSPREVGIALSTLSLQGTVSIDPTGLVRRCDTPSIVLTP